MAKTIVGLDIGHWSVKIATLDLRDHSIIGFAESLHPSSAAIIDPPDFPSHLQASLQEEGGEHVSGLDGEGEKRADTPLENETFSDEATEEGGAPPVWLETLRRLSSEPVITDAEVICCSVPPSYVTFLQVPVPFEDEEKVATILPSLLDSRLTADLSTFFWSFYVEKSTLSNEEEVQPFQARVAVIEKENLKKFLGELRSVGINPNYVVFAPLAISEALQAEGLLSTIAQEVLSPVASTPTAPTAFLNLGHSTATLTVLDQRRGEGGGVSVATARTTMLGLLQIAESIAAELDISADEVIRYLYKFQGFFLPSTGEDLPTEAEFHLLEQRRRFNTAFQKSLRPLVRDIRRTLQGLYARANIQVESIYLLGGGAKITGLAEELANQLGTGVTLFPSAKISPQLASLRQNILSWGLAVAASQPAVRRKTCNFRRAEFLYRGRSSYLRRQMMVLSFGFLVVLLLLFGIFFTKKKAMIAQRDAMHAELTKQTKELFEVPVYQKKKIQTLLEGKGSGSEKGLIPTRSAFEIAYDIVSHIPADISLNLSKFEVDTRRSIAQLRGDTTDAQAVDRIVSSLEGLPCIKDIKKERLTLRGDRADFELQINTEGCS